MMKRIVSLFSFVAICIICFFGCGENYVSEEDKYDQYVAFNNSYLQVVNHSASSYLETFGGQQTLLVPENSSAIPTFMLIAGIPRNSERSMEFANKKPASVADAAVLVLGEKSMNYVKVFEEITAYYNDKSYQKDNFAKGQLLHTQYLTALEECEAAFDDFLEQLAVMETEQLEKSLKKLKKDGNDYEYYLLKCLIDGQKMVNYFHQNEIDDTNLLSIDKLKFDPLYQAYTEDCEGLKAAIKERDDWDYQNTTTQDYLLSILNGARDIQEALAAQEADPDANPIEYIAAAHNRAIDFYNARR